MLINCRWMLTAMWQKTNSAHPAKRAISPLAKAGISRIFTPGAPLGEITSWLENTLDEREAAGTA